MNYREKIKAEHWNRKMWSRNEGKWGAKIRGDREP